MGVIRKGCLGVIEGGMGDGRILGGMGRERRIFER